MGRGDSPRWQAPPAGIRLHLEFDSRVLEESFGVSGLSNGVLRGEALSVQEDGLLFWVEIATSGLTWADESRILLLDRDILERARIREQGNRVGRQGRWFDASNPADMNYIARWARYPQESHNRHGGRHRQ